ncbi:MAG: glycosyltransferase family 4 protein [Coxiellaceae bacterium]|nr:glycosyltransferase family 4 protein [Coxiellaceae bacterium]
MAPQDSLKAPFFLITPWFGTFAGGGGRAIASLAEMFQRCGYSVTVLTTCSRSPYEDWRSSCYPAGESWVDNIRVLRFPVDQSDSRLYHEAVVARSRGESVCLELQQAFFERGINSQALIEYVWRLDRNAVVIAGTYFQSLVPSVINAHPGRIVALPAFHNEPEFYWMPIANMIENSRKILFLSREEKDLAIRVYGHRVGQRLVENPVVGLGVQLTSDVQTKIEGMDFLRQVRISLSLPEHYLVYVGRIENAKGLSYLIPWINNLNKIRIAKNEFLLPLVLIGDGPLGVVPESPYMLKLGYLPEAEKLAVMRQSIALINPSMLESFSYVVMEAWLAGAPVLVPRGCAVTAGHVDRCAGGLVYEDETEFSIEVESLLNPKVRDALATQGQQYVRTQFRWPDVMDRILRAVLL